MLTKLWICIWQINSFSIFCKSCNGWMNIAVGWSVSKYLFIQSLKAWLHIRETSLSGLHWTRCSFLNLFITSLSLKTKSCFQDVSTGCFSSIAGSLLEICRLYLEHSVKASHKHAKRFYENGDSEIFT